MCIHIVERWWSNVLQLLDCMFDLLDGDRPKFDVQVLFCLTNDGNCTRDTSVEEILNVFSSSL